jgi:glycosyltransferase involved in cell wall biosynthesis
MVPPECGFAVEQGTLEEVIDALASCLERLASDRVLCEQMGAACRRTVRERYIWEQRHRAIRDWYRAAGI